MLEAAAGIGRASRRRRTSPRTDTGRIVRWRTRGGLRLRKPRPRRRQWPVLLVGTGLDGEWTPRASGRRNRCCNFVRRIHTPAPTPWCTRWAVARTARAPRSRRSTAPRRTYKSSRSRSPRSHRQDRRCPCQGVGRFPTWGTDRPGGVKPRGNAPRKYSNRFARRTRTPGCSLSCRSSARGSTRPWRPSPRTRRPAHNGRRSPAGTRRRGLGCIHRRDDRGSVVARCPWRTPPTCSNTGPRTIAASSLSSYRRTEIEARRLRSPGARRRFEAPIHSRFPR